MKSLSAFAILCLLSQTAFLPIARAADTTPAPAATDNDTAYTATLEKRSAAIIDALDLGDSAKSTRVKARLIAHYRALNAWQQAHETTLKNLRTPKSGGAISPEAEAAHAEREKLRQTFLADLAKELTPAQIDIVKDALTYKKLQVTYDGYLQQLPDLTDGQKKKIHDWLAEAREEAIVGVSAEEKTEIFGRYKGRINNFLSQEGYDLKKAGKDWKARRDAEAARKNNP